MQLHACYFTSGFCTAAALAFVWWFVCVCVCHACLVCFACLACLACFACLECLACMRACVRACVRASVRTCVCLRMRLCMRACMRVRTSVRVHACVGSHPCHAMPCHAMPRHAVPCRGPEGASKAWLRLASRIWDLPQRVCCEIAVAVLFVALCQSE